MSGIYIIDSPVTADFNDSSDDEAILFDDVGESVYGSEYRRPSMAPAHPHPIPTMQGPFEESISESLEQMQTGKPPLQFSDLTAEERRERLLAGEDYNDTYNAMWRDDPVSKFHPLTKIIAQIAYGVHLLHMRMAKSNDEVTRILQRHIDEVDEFIGRADEDLGMALADIGSRVGNLTLALENKATFDHMLEDRDYRLQVLHGNDVIEMMIKRSAALLKDLMADVRCGMESIEEMSHYIATLGPSWPTDLTDIGLYNTMLANTEGWSECFESLKFEGRRLGKELTGLHKIAHELTKRAAVVSRNQALKKKGSASAPDGRSGSPPLPMTPLDFDSPDLDSKPLPAHPYPLEPDLIVRSLQDKTPKTNRSSLSRSDGVSLYRRKTNISDRRATAISDKRSSTATIASLFVPVAMEREHDPMPELPKIQIEQQQKIIEHQKSLKKTKIPKLPKIRRLSMDKFSFARPNVLRRSGDSTKEVAESSEPPAEAETTSPAAESDGLKRKSSSPFSPGWTLSPLSLPERRISGTAPNALTLSNAPVSPAPSIMLPTPPQSAKPVVNIHKKNPSSTSPKTKPADVNNLTLTMDADQSRHSPNPSLSEESAQRQHSGSSASGTYAGSRMSHTPSTDSPTDDGPRKSVFYGSAQQQSFGVPANTLVRPKMIDVTKTMNTSSQNAGASNSMAPSVHSPHTVGSLSSTSGTPTITSPYAPQAPNTPIVETTFLTLGSGRYEGPKSQTQTQTQTQLQPPSALVSPTSSDGISSPNTSQMKIKRKAVPRKAIPTRTESTPEAVKAVEGPTLNATAYIPGSTSSTAALAPAVLQPSVTRSAPPTAHIELSNPIEFEPFRLDATKASTIEPKVLDDAIAQPKNEEKSSGLYELPVRDGFRDSRPWLLKGPRISVDGLGIDLHTLSGSPTDEPFNMLPAVEDVADPDTPPPVPAKDEKYDTSRSGAVPRTSSSLPNDVVVSKKPWLTESGSVNGIGTRHARTPSPLINGSQSLASRPQIPRSVPQVINDDAQSIMRPSSSATHHIKPSISSTQASLEPYGYDPDSDESDDEFTSLGLRSPSANSNSVLGALSMRSNPSPRGSIPWAPSETSRPSTSRAHTPLLPETSEPSLSPLSAHPVDTSMLPRSPASLDTSRPGTSRSSMRPNTRSKLGLFPVTATSSMLDLRAARSEVTLPLAKERQRSFSDVYHDHDEGVGEEAESALPGPPPRLVPRRMDMGVPVAAGGSVGTKFKKWFGRR